MYLKSVEIVGFKSFAEKTRLEFKPGITGIIGPNGCGKSNVMESIRWCIGEMSWKSLRSASMVDVIFAGTAKRNPVGLAEVTLTFDNASSMLPVQYSEVTVARRLFRSGESEYYLNKTQCRLRDIRELFLDTGIGGDGYAIIDQGGVDFVMKAKPEDRRALFEEAAGVSKYKAKREEALRKLERVDMDLARLGDSITLIGEQIKKLDSDARKAKLYQKHKEELAAMEAGQIIQEVAALSAELEREAALAAPIQEDLGRARAELAGEEARLSAATLERTSLEAQVLESNQKLSALKSEIAILSERINNARREMEDLRRRRETSSAETATESGRLEAMDPEIDAARAAVAQADEKLAGARSRLEAFRAETAGIEAALAAVRAEAEEARGRALAATEAALESSRRLSTAQSALSRQEGELRGTSKERDKSLAKSEACRAEAAALSEKLFAQLFWAGDGAAFEAGLKARGQELGAEMKALDGEIFQARAELVGLQARVEALEAQGAQDPYWVGAHAVLNAGIAGVLGTVRSLLTVPDAFGAKVEDALGERLYAVVCEDLAAAKAAVEFLEASGKGRARLLVLSSLPAAFQSQSYPSEAKPLIDQVTCEPRFEPVLRYLLAECYCLGRELYGAHWVCGGSESSQVLPLKLSDLRALRDKAASLELDAAGLASAKAALADKAAALEARIQEASQARSEETSRANVLAASLRGKEESLSAQEEETRGLEVQSRRLSAELDSIREAIAAAQAALIENQAREKELREAEAAASKRRDALANDAASRGEQEGTLSQALDLAGRERDFLRDKADGLAMEKEKLERSLSRRKAEIEGIEASLASAKRLEAESMDCLDARHAELAGLEIEAQKLSGVRQELLLAGQKLEESIRGLRARGGELQEYLHQRELNASGLRAKQESLRGRLWDEWQLTYEEAASKYFRQPVDPEKILTLRKRIQNMGNINMAAPEEYEALAQKHGFLRAQVDDLAKAKDDLRSAIAKINSTTRENFRQTFMEVREHFRRIYATLFDGGEADLVLTDQDNLLETGVEIVAQPPGKRLQSITLLSGGEKTMTAIALLFAFFMVKPSPVCMLDEADAALDEANTERFVSMLREFSGKSQFLIVSHSKKTMEAAETIYGVTMEESGVSQLISVDFRRKPAPAAETAADATAA